MFSVVIRNKNEVFYLNKVLNILTSVYSEDIDEIIVVDNESTDESVKIAKQYNCKIVSISDFSYGRAINIGISNAKNNNVLLLSSHAIPVGKSFFKNSLEFLSKHKDTGGLRYINSIDNYERAIQNNCIVEDPLKYGLMAACCTVVKDVWLKHKFDEDLEFSEDKEWSLKITELGYKIFDIDETFFYFLKRTISSNINRYKNETLAYYKLNNVKPPSKLKIIGSFFKKVTITNNVSYFKLLIVDYKKAKAKYEINTRLKKINHKK
jgi:glycosyltransferase involved in cell wall biosynthesis